MDLTADECRKKAADQMEEAERKTGH